LSLILTGAPEGESTLWVASADCKGVPKKRPKWRRSSPKKAPSYRRMATVGGLSALQFRSCFEEDALRLPPHSTEATPHTHKTRIHTIRNCRFHRCNHRPDTGTIRRCNRFPCSPGKCRPRSLSSWSPTALRTHRSIRVRRPEQDLTKITDSSLRPFIRKRLNTPRLNELCGSTTA